MIVTIIATALAASTVSAAPVERVSYADLDLSSAKDRRILDRRIAGATERVCGSYASVSAEDADRITACRKVAKAGVAPQLAKIDAREKSVLVAGRTR